MNHHWLDARCAAAYCVDAGGDVGVEDVIIECSRLLPKSSFEILITIIHIRDSNRTTRGREGGVGRDNYKRERTSAEGKTEQTHMFLLGDLPFHPRK